MGAFKDTITEIVISQKNYRNPDFSESILAEMLGVSIFRMSRIIKAEFGASYADIVLSNRVEDVKKMLKMKRFKTYTVEDIGVIAGFRNKQSLFEAFKKYAHTTPGKYRRATEILNNKS